MITWTISLGPTRCRVRLYTEDNGPIRVEERNGVGVSSWSLKHRNKSTALRWAHGELARMLRHEATRLWEGADKVETMIRMGDWSELITRSDSAP